MKPIIGIAIATTLALAAMTSLANAETITWKANTPFVEARSEAQALQRWAQTVNERTDGQLNIEVYTGGSLGIKDADMLRILPQNIVQVAQLFPGYLTRDVPEIAVTLPAGVVQNHEMVKELAPVLTEIYQDIYDQWDLTLLGYTMQPVRETSIFCKEPVNSLEQLKGKKLRVWERHHADTFTKLGVAAQIIPQGDLYVALQTGVVDCAVYLVGYTKSISLHEVAPYEAYLFPYVTHPVGLVVSNTAWNQLSPDLQDTVRELTKEIEDETFAIYLSGEFEDEARKEMAELGLVSLEPFPQEDREAFRAAAVDAWLELASEAGEKAMANVEMIRNAVGQ